MQNFFDIKTSRHDYDNVYHRSGIYKAYIEFANPTISKEIISPDEAPQKPTGVKPATNIVSPSTEENKHRGGKKRVLDDGSCNYL